MLTEFKYNFDNSYETIFQKILVSKAIANMRFESVLSYGDRVQRVLPNIDGVRVRQITIGVDRTIDPISDTREEIVINQIYGTTHQISDVEMIQAGPLNPGEYFGTKMAKKMAIHVDARVFNQIKNAANTFDTGDLTTLASTGVPIDLRASSFANIPTLSARAKAKLRFAENQDLSFGTFSMVVDSYALSDIEEYIMGKQIDIAQSVFENGYIGDVAAARVYVSENLSPDAVLTITGNPTDGQTIIFNGYTYTFKTALTPTEGEILIEANVDLTRANLEDAINQASGTAGTKYVVWTDTAPTYKLSKWLALNLTATNNDTADTLSITGIGSGRLVIGGTATIASTVNYIHCYYGRNGAIDAVVQKGMRAEDTRMEKQMASVFKTEALHGEKVFTDGSKQFLDVWIKA